MKDSTRRSILRWTHIVFGLTLLGYIYGPPDETRPYLPFFRYFYFPAVLLSGLWMWKGQAVRRLLSGRSNDRTARTGIAPDADAAADNH